MNALIPLKLYLEENELEEGTTLILKSETWKPEIGIFVGMIKEEYVVKLNKISHVFGESPRVDISYLFVPIAVQKFHVLSLEDSDTTELLK